MLTTLKLVVVRALGPLPTGFVKINFDGSSKGNPRPTVFGVIVEDNEGKILHFAVGYLGLNTNIIAKL